MKKGLLLAVIALGVSVNTFASFYRLDVSNLEGNGYLALGDQNAQVKNVYLVYKDFSEGRSLYVGIIEHVDANSEWQVWKGACEALPYVTFGLDEFQCGDIKIGCSQMGWLSYYKIGDEEKNRPQFNWGEDAKATLVCRKVGSGEAA